MTYPSVLAMWLAMTAIMMTPVVYPWLRALNRVAAGGAVSSVTPFLGGYMLAWAGFSAVAAAVHFALAAAALPMPLGILAPTPSAAALILTRSFQFTAPKEACLSHCRSPAGFLRPHWRPGAAGHTRPGL